MRRSERARRLPARYSPSLSSSKDGPPSKENIMARYMSKNFKLGKSTRTAAVKSAAVIAEPPSSSSQNSNRGFDALSKYAKPGEPSIVEIFGVAPDDGALDADAALLDEIDVTGDAEPSKEPPSWIETGPLEGKCAPRQNMSKLALALAKLEADLLSESAALPLPAFPLSGGPEIEGASHPDNNVKPAAKGLAPQKKKLIQQHLILLLHAYKCERAAITKFPCPVPFCSVMKKVQSHMRQCTDGYNCVAPFCSSSRRIMCHWKHCKTPDCVVCSRLKCLAMTKRKKELEKMKAMGQAPNQNANVNANKVPEIIVIDGPEDPAPSQVKMGKPLPASNNAA